ncbi:reverse transcriptase family protein [Vreelandella titanicae]|uniref:reverse transcriptase family protein n=1 Tax=Vreelandella titanicae TaxID=664683 RepID=UPI00380BA944
MADKPYYPHPPIGSVSVLAAMLKINEKQLIHIASNASSSYTSFEITPEGKKPRDVVEPKEQLKYVQKKINAMIFSEVNYPDYLMGGISDKEKPRDYINNGKLHLNKNTLINLDVENFFPNIKYIHVKKIFTHLFRFSEPVSEILTQLTTLNGRVPQGGCCSTYIANLLFFNYEYHIVSKLRTKGIVYSRLLDDITLSSDKKLDKNDKKIAISAVDGLIKRFELNINNTKTRIEHKDNLSAKYQVTGSWVRFGELKFPSKDRKRIRSAVKKCENMYLENCYSEEYHTQWNKTSGLVAQLKRFGHHKQEREFRIRLGKILPLYDEQQAITLRTKVYQLIKKRKTNRLRLDNPGLRKQILILYHQLGILSRNNPSSKALKIELRQNFGSLINNPYY